MDFGQNLIARNSGVIRVGDEGGDLAAARQKLMAPQRSTTALRRKTPGRELTIDWRQGQAFCGNNPSRYYWNGWRIRIRIPYSRPAGLVSVVAAGYVAGRRSKSAEKIGYGDDGTILRLAAACLEPRYDWKIKPLLFKAETVTVNLRFQPVVHNFNCIAKLHGSACYHHTGWASRHNAAFSPGSA